MKKYRKSYKANRKKSKLRIFKKKIAWFFVLILILISGLAYFFFFSSVFQVKSIEISEVKKSSEKEIKKIVSQNVNNIFTSDLERVVSEISKKYPQIDKVEIKRNLPDKIYVEIKERTPVAVSCKDFSCYFVDSKGVAFEETYKKEGLAVIKLQGFKLGDKIIKEDILKAVIKINNGLKNIIAYPVSDDRLNIQTEEGWKIYFNPKEDIDWQIEKLEILLKEKLPVNERGSLEYIDLRFKKVYFKRSN